MTIEEHIQVMVKMLHDTGSMRPVMEYREDNGLDVGLEVQALLQFRKDVGIVEVAP